MTVVTELQSGGILRLGGMKTGFRYRYARGGKPGPRHLEHISTLRIPPAWKSVAIDPSRSAWIQAVGQDKAGRWQYLYHERAVEKRERRKYRRLLAFTRNLPRLRARVSQDLARKGYDQDHVLACMLRILSLCFLRPGSEEYASENGSYGITTLRPRHVQVRGSVVRLRFNGKSGQDAFHELDDRRVASTVRALLAAGGRRVFTFQDATGAWKEVRRQHINAYIKDAMGGAFSAKDFRTWAGTITCACALARIGVDTTDSVSARKKKVVAAVKETADTLGNTPAVCRSSYISPCVIRAYEEGRVIRGAITSVSALATSRNRLRQCERSLLRVLEAFGQSTKARSVRKRVRKEAGDRRHKRGKRQSLVA
jgi:DNA topoisomerase-1